MSTIDIRAALEAALDTITPLLATARENQSFAPPSQSTAYQQVNILFAEPENLEFGRHHREQGYMQVKLMYPLQLGTNAAAARAELIRTVFYRGASFVKNAAVVIIEKTPEISGGSVEDGKWAVLVKIRFFANVN